MICDQYQTLGRLILEQGQNFNVGRNGASCSTIWAATMYYKTSNPEGYLHINTTRNAPYKLAIAELLGYIRGATDAETFKQLGAPTWFANAAAENWQKSGYAKSETDMGIVYGAVGNNWPVLTPDPENPDKLIHTGSIDLLDKIYQNLKNGIDDRGEIWNFWNPGMFQLGCLRPCMYSHHFTLLDGTLNLMSTQRSADWPLGVVANMVQVQVLLRVMAQITGNKVGDCLHVIPNAHIYENQLETFAVEMSRDVYHELPKLEINPDIKTLEDLRTWVTVDDFKLIDYVSHETDVPKEHRIRYEFTT